MGKPGTFGNGPDPRRNTKGRGPSASTTLASMARNDRDGTFKALTRLRDGAEDERVQLEAARTLAAYSDGKPKDAETEPEQSAGEPPLTPEEAKLLSFPGGGQKKEGET